MARLSMCVVAVSASLVGMGFAMAAASAQEQECKDEEVTASGPARPLEVWAKRVARNMWRRQVQAAHGEQFEDINHAKRVNYVCSPASLGRRCTLTAVPCKVPGTLKEEDRREYRVLDREELTKSLQQELERVGCYRDSIDGQWGENSRRALRRFARNTDSRVDTEEPTSRALKLVEETNRRVCDR